MIFGRVLDPTGSAVVGAQVTVTNVDTRATVRLATNDTGYYEAPLLVPGNYQVVSEASGFKQTIRKGITLPISTRAQIDISLEIGAVSESVSVTSEAPLLETNAVSTGQIIDQRSLRDLPTLNNNPTLLARLAPGIQTAGGAAGYTNPAFTFIGSSFYTAGNVGGNDYSIDGVPNNGNIRRISYQPHTDAVSEFKVETSNFDAAVGHSTGASFTVMTKSGTNQYHGSASLQHWRNEWNAANFFVKQSFYRQIAAAAAAGDTATANRLRNTNFNPVGHSNNYSGTFGGPLTIPKLYSGKDRTFFFISMSGVRDRTQANTSYWNRTVPTMSQRTGDFTDLLKVDAVRYQLYDPLTVRADSARPTHFVRDPIPGNILPLSRIVNPTYKAYLKYYPVPNNNPVDPTKEPTINYIARQIPWQFDYDAWAGRIDHQQSERSRFFVRGQYWTNIEHNQDWLYETVKGAGELAGDRFGIGTAADWVYTPTSALVLNLSVGFQQFNDAIVDNQTRKVEPSAVGLPSYLDAKAGAHYTLPYIDNSGYDMIGRGYYGLPNRHRNLFAKADVSWVRGAHTLRAGMDQQQLFKSTFGFGTSGLNTSGYFGFDNFFTRKNDDGFTPAGSLGHSWAAYLMGIPSGMSIGTYDSAALKNSAYGWYVQDGWRLSAKLTVNLGLRLEYETAPTERYNRAIGWFDPTLKLPIADAAQAAYAQKPIPELQASAFSVVGGATYLGTNGVSRSFYGNAWMLMPRLAAAYQVTPKTVLRGGYGMFYDTLNVRDFSYTFPNQFGYSRDTSTTITNDFGQTFQTGNPYQGVSPMSDPFPVRADGTRFNSPLRNALGAMAVSGRGFGFIPSDLKHARQQRWRIGVQRQFGANMLIDAGYAGSYSDNVYISKTLQPLPAQYWNTSAVRNDAIASNLNSNVTNPFYIANFASLKSSNPAVYQDISTNGFFTSPTIRKSQLLLPYPQVNGLTNSYAPDGKVKTHELQVRLERRFAQGFNLNASYTRAYGRAADYFYNSYDPDPSWRESGSTRPHRITATGVLEMPFGKGKRFASSGWLSHLAGGFEVAATYEFQPGPLVSFGNLFFYGDPNGINSGTRTLDQWFNTTGVTCAQPPGQNAGFERCASRGPASFQARVFPVFIDGLRAQSTNIWNANVQREFKLHERALLQIRFDVLNAFNHETFAGPDTNPFSSNFGKITNTTGTSPRFVQIQAKLRF